MNGTGVCNETHGSFMAQTYSWKYASGNDFAELCSLLWSAKPKPKNWHGLDDIRRRIIIPLFRGQLITFHNNANKLCGFLTFAWLSKETAKHHDTLGILPYDWKSGPDLWAVDFFAIKGHGYRMLMSMRRDKTRLSTGRLNYFRDKHHKFMELNA